MTHFADTFVDRSLIGSHKGWTPPVAIGGKIARIVEDMQSFKWALTIPRRLGGTDNDEAARDKKGLRRALHLQSKILLTWCKIGEVQEFEVGEPSSRERMLGAQVNLREWTFAREREAEQDRSLFATFCIVADEVKMANRTTALLTTEIEDLRRIRLTV